MATGSMPAATAAAPPELDQPGTRLVSQGLRASASQLKGLKMPSPANAPPPPAPSMLLVPMMIAPDFLRRRSEEHTSELQSLMRISYAVFCLKKKNDTSNTTT